MAKSDTSRRRPGIHVPAALLESIKETARMAGVTVDELVIAAFTRWAQLDRPTKERLLEDFWWKGSGVSEEKPVRQRQRPLRTTHVWDEAGQRWLQPQAALAAELEARQRSWWRGVAETRLTRRFGRLLGRGRQDREAA